MARNRARIIWILAAVLLCSCGDLFSSRHDKQTGYRAIIVDRSLHDQAIGLLKKRCEICHNPAVPSGGIYYITRLDLLVANQIIIPQKPLLSPLYSMLIAPEGIRMPKSPMPALELSEIELLKNWIERGISSRKSLHNSFTSYP